MYRDIGRKFLKKKKWWDFCSLTSTVLQEIYCLFKLKSLLELIIN